MSDARLTPSNGRVADISLAGTVMAERYIVAEAGRIIADVVDLCPAPGKRRDRQLIYGEAVGVYERQDGWAFVQARKDGYVGYIRESSLGPALDPTHFVATAGTHAYEGESFKSRELRSLSLGARVAMRAEGPKMWDTDAGFIPKKHLRPLEKPFTDPATVAQAFFGTPYLWGGNSRAGIDCSGLIQAALTACAVPCPGDSDLQRAALGRALPPGSDRQRNDLYFWKGHVGILVDADTLLHANAHHMATVYEPIEAAILRIAAQGDGPVLAHKRL